MGVAGSSHPKRPSKARGRRTLAAPAGAKRAVNGSPVRAAAARKNGAASRSPIAKSPVAKSPVAKSPVAKSPVAKSPVAKSPLVFTFYSDLASSRDVHKAIMDRVESMHYDEQSAFAIRLALEEGLMNAIKHGNKHDTKKTVHVEAKVTPKSTQITIEDQGKGFTRLAVPDPCAEENLLKCSGRGLLLMEAYMDKIEYSRGGRRVKMIKKNG